MLLVSGEVAAKTVRDCQMCPPTMPSTYQPVVVHGRRGRGSEIFFVDRRYSNMQIVGSGSYGVVCSAFDNSSNRRVAIKKVKKVLEDSGDARRVLRELRILRHLGGKENTLKVVDVYTHPPDTPEFEDVYIVTELMETDLDKVLRSDQPLENEHTAYFLYQILRSTANMHRSRVLHRDLKPSNILVNANCDLKVCDFGLSRGVKNLQPMKGEEQTDATKEDFEHLTEYVVTRWYRPPEILAESQCYGASADIWGVGCILAEMLSIDRRPIFRGTSPQNQMSLILKALGIPSARELEFCTSALSHGTINRLAQDIKRENFRPWNFHERFPVAPPMAIDLLQKMLKFDPRDRITAEEALRHPFLANLHRSWRPPAKARRFDSSFESVHKSKIPKADLQNLFLYEVSKYRRVWCPISKPLYHKLKPQKQKRKSLADKGSSKRDDEAGIRMLGATRQCNDCSVINQESSLPSTCHTCEMLIQRELPAISGNMPTYKGNEHFHLQATAQGKVKSKLMAQIAAAESRDSTLPKIENAQRGIVSSPPPKRKLGKVCPLISPTRNVGNPVHRASNQETCEQRRAALALSHRRSRSAPIKRRSLPRTIPHHPAFDVPSSYAMASRTPAGLGGHPLSAR